MGECRYVLKCFEGMGMIMRDYIFLMEVQYVRSGDVNTG